MRWGSKHKGFCVYSAASSYIAYQIIKWDPLLNCGVEVCKTLLNDDCISLCVILVLQGSDPKLNKRHIVGLHLPSTELNINVKTKAY